MGTRERAIITAAIIGAVGAVLASFVLVVVPKLLIQETTSSSITVGAPTTPGTIPTNPPQVAPTQPPANVTPQEIIVPSGSSQQVLAGDCVDTWQLANIHATYNLVFQKPSWVRVKITENGSVDGKATIYRNSGCYSS